MEPRIAKTAVLDNDNYVFDVDGKPFPWYLPENPTVSARKLADGCYKVELTFLAVLFEHPQSPCSVEQTEWGQPFICGLEFPWWIGETVVFALSRTAIPAVALSFFAEHVEGIDVTDVECPEDGKIHAFDGRIIHKVGV